ncbi:MAG: hypothetical protein JWM91_3731 [Rhodospirillales bacterium]|nr:hypothetical protein [Rhodospirillales bacterium]
MVGDLEGLLSGRNIRRLPAVARISGRSRVFLRRIRLVGDATGHTGPGIALAARALLAAYICLPFSAGGATYLDSRVSLMLALVVAAGLQPPAMSMWQLGSIAAPLAAALIAEVISIGTVWHDHEAVVADLRASVAAVPPGSKVLTVSAPFDPAAPYWQAAPPGLTAFGIFRIDSHLPALLAIDRRAFWPFLFSDPSQHPIAVRPPYDVISGDGEPPTVQSLVAGRSLDPHWSAAYLRDWPENFDFVLVLDADGAGELSHLLPDRLRLLNRSHFTALFAVRKPGDFGPP